LNLSEPHGARAILGGYALLALPEVGLLLAFLIEAGYLRRRKVMFAVSADGMRLGLRQPIP
jgi:hypothetical protein